MLFFPDSSVLCLIVLTCEMWTIACREFREREIPVPNILLCVFLFFLLKQTTHISCRLLCIVCCKVPSTSRQHLLLQSHLQNAFFFYVFDDRIMSVFLSSFLTISFSLLFIVSYFSSLWQQIILYFPCQTFRCAHFCNMLTERDHKKAFALWNKRIAVCCFIIKCFQHLKKQCRTSFLNKVFSVWHLCLRSFQWLVVCFLYASCFLLCCFRGMGLFVCFTLFCFWIQKPSSCFIFCMF